MAENHAWTCVFHIFVSALSAAPFLFVLHYWHEAKTKGWSWTSVDSRGMYVDGDPVKDQRELNRLPVKRYLRISQPNNERGD